MKLNVFFQYAERETTHSEVIHFPFLQSISSQPHCWQLFLNNLTFVNLCKYAWAKKCVGLILTWFIILFSTRKAYLQQRREESKASIESTSKGKEKKNFLFKAVESLKHSTDLRKWNLVTLFPGTFASFLRKPSRTFHCTNFQPFPAGSVTMDQAAC